MNEELLVLKPTNELIFRGPFGERNVCQLTLENISDGRVGFKMKCTAADYYASNPSHGIIEPKTNATISVYLWEQQGQDLLKVDYKKHKFGVTFLPVTNDCTTADIDRTLRHATREECRVAYLRSIILAEGQEYKPSSPILSLRQRTETVSSVCDRPSPPKPATKPIRRQPSERDYHQELLLKESVISEIQKEKEELVNRCEAEKKELRAELEEKLAKTKEDMGKIENEKVKQILAEKHRKELQEEKNLTDTLKKEKEQLLLRCSQAEAALQQLQRDQEMLGNPVPRKEDSIQDISFWEASHTDIKIAEKIGEGGWGYVGKGLYKEQRVAIKCLHANIVSAYSITTLKREVSMMAKVRHPCLLLFIAVVFDHPSGSPMIITELMDCSLRDVYKKLEEKSKINIMFDIACALHYLHTHKDKILHRDVSSANVLIHQTVNNLYRGKLSDFGSANLARYAVSAGPGAELYMAPEIPRESAVSAPKIVQQTTKIDVYSYGVLLCEVFCSEPQLPFREVFPSMLESIRGRFPFMHEQIVKCTSRDSKNRPEILSVLYELRNRFSKVLHNN